MDESNRTSLVVVAIPSEDDYVWKLSSEKVPHLTLLYLGKQEVGPETAQIAEFVEHAASTSLRRFGLSVDRRGELGDDNADVLFFENEFSKEIQEFRSNLLKHDVIRKAYESTDQFPSWTPHLTLGYPENPAKPDDREYSGIGWVNFDRVALWTGDSEGPIFRLKSHDDGLEVAMSSDAEDRRRSQVEKVLAHYGVRGMKWGVRRTQAEIDAASYKGPPLKGAPASADAVKAATAFRKARGSKISSLSNDELAALNKRLNLEKNYKELSSKIETRGKGRAFVEDLVKDEATSYFVKGQKGNATKAVERLLATTAAGTGKHRK